MTRRHRSRASVGLLAVVLAASPAFGLAEPPSPAALTTAAEDEQTAARTLLESAEARLVSLEQERAIIEADHSTLDANQLKLARELESALRDTRQFAVEAYVAGGPPASIGEVLAANDVGDAIWRSEVLASQTAHGLERAGALRDLMGRSDSAVRQIALRGDQNRRKVEAAIAEAIGGAGDAEQIRTDAASMRARMLRELPSDGPWDVKQRPGGQVEVEFVAQALQLIHGREYPGVCAPTARVALRHLAEAGVLPVEDATLLIRADRVWRTVQGMLRITVGRDGKADLPDITASLLLRACSAAGADAVDLAGLRVTLDAMAKQVRAIFVRHIGEIGT